MRNVLLITALLWVASCQSDTDSLTDALPAQEGVITICGSMGEGGLPTSTRASEPALSGVCHADKLRLRIYHATGAGPGLGDMTAKVDVTEDLVSTYTSPAGSVDRWHRYQHTPSSIDGLATGGFSSDRNWYQIQALAYNSDADGYWTVTSGNAKESVIFLTRDAEQYVNVPELFFGRLTFDDSGASKSGTGGNDLFWYRWTSGNDSRKSAKPVYGRLYRIVSQLNLLLTNVPRESVHSIELWATGVPVALQLYENSAAHGAFYPITAFDSSLAFSGQTCVAKADSLAVDDGGNLTLSTYLLPSLSGLVFTLKLNMWQPVLQADGSLRDQLYVRERFVAPSESVSIADAAGIYNTPLKSGGMLPIYNNSTMEFYSYANVRTNISGRMEYVGAEVSVADISLSVEPSYEKEHAITAN